MKLIACVKRDGRTYYLNVNQIKEIKFGMEKGASKCYGFIIDLKGKFHQTSGFEVDEADGVVMDEDIISAAVDVITVEL